MIIGICGGYQMLGHKVTDPGGVEWKAADIDGLGLLDVVTEFAPHKITAQVKAKAQNLPFYRGGVCGYEIHMGHSELGRNAKPAFCLERRGAENIQLYDGAVNSDGSVWGTYLHGLFDNDDFRNKLLAAVRNRRGLAAYEQKDNASAQELQQQAYDRLADIVRNSLDMDLLYSILQNGVA